MRVDEALVEGISLVGLRRDFCDERVRARDMIVREMVEDGLMAATDERWRLTLRGRMVSNEVFGRLLETVAA